jgi:hypothetical protein
LQQRIKLKKGYRLSLLLFWGGIRNFVPHPDPPAMQPAPVRSRFVSCIQLHSHRKSGGDCFCSAGCRCPIKQVVDPGVISGVIIFGALLLPVAIASWFSYLTYPLVGRPLGTSVTVNKEATFRLRSE